MIRTESPWRRSLAVLGLSTFLAAGLQIARSDGTAARPAPAPAPAAAAVRPRLIAPGFASAGERLPVLAFRYRGCGPVQLRFDGTPADHQLTRYAKSVHPDWTEMFVTVTVPPAAAGGRHEIQLYGACQAGPLDTTIVELGMER